MQARQAAGRGAGRAGQAGTRRWRCHGASACSRPPASHLRSASPPAHQRQNLQEKYRHQHRPTSSPPPRHLAAEALSRPGWAGRHSQILMPCHRLPLVCQSLQKRFAASKGQPQRTSPTLPVLHLGAKYWELTGHPRPQRLPDLPPPRLRLRLREDRRRWGLVLRCSRLRKGGMGAGQGGRSRMWKLGKGAAGGTAHVACRQAQGRGQRTQRL